MLDLQESEVASFFSLSDFNETTYAGKDGYVLKVVGTNVKLVALSASISITDVKSDSEISGAIAHAAS
ncbi:hypothetical protein, partial [Caballeronia sp. AAUFL_F1_KS45]|uniref:hypothetical protein n=1 Tax=Caballeronia sp. AAUFL_F1_KS45 TaxID=2921770 RepID=UPI00202909D9